MTGLFYVLAAIGIAAIVVGYLAIRDRFDHYDYVIGEMKTDYEKRFQCLSELSKDYVVAFDKIDTDLCKIKSDIEGFTHAQKMNNFEFPRTIPVNDPYDIRLTEITVGDDPNQMSKGTTV